MSASLSADSAPADPDDELLVAYLDGELKRDERSELENRLLKEEPLRGRLTQLQSSWDMLDILAVDGSGVSLVETTLELAIADVSLSPSSQSQSRVETKSAWRSNKMTSVLVLCAVAGILGWFLAAMKSRHEYQAQLRDLAIAEDLDAYNHGGDLKLMRSLAADPNWTQLVATAAELSQESSQTQSMSQVSLDQRSEAIERLSVDQREHLGARWDAFSRLSDEDQEAIRQRAAAVAVQPDKETLLETMRAYATWRSRLPSGLVGQIEGEDAGARRRAIQDAIEESKSSMAATAGSQLDSETVDVIYFALQEFVNKRMSKDQRGYRLPGGFRGPLDNLKTREWFAMRQLFSYTDRREPSGRGRNGRDQDRNRRDESLTASELSTIESLLPVQSQETLDILTGGDPTLVTMALQVWVEEVIRRKMPLRSNDSPLQRYQKFSDRQREVIDLMTPEKMMQEVSKSRSFRQ